MTSVPVQKKPVQLDRTKATCFLQYVVIGDHKANREVIFTIVNDVGNKFTLIGGLNEDGGLAFDLPTNGRYHLSSIQIAEVIVRMPEPYIEFSPTEDFINHLGFIEIKVSGSSFTFYSSPRTGTLTGTVRKAIDSWGLPKGRIINSYSKKPITDSTFESEDWMVRYNSVDSNVNIDYEADRRNCYENEVAINPFLFGTLRFNVIVKKSKISAIQTMKSNHTATQKYEDCIKKAIESASIRGKEFTVSIPGLFPGK